jgi:hypothetical protein
MLLENDTGEDGVDVDNGENRLCVGIRSGRRRTVVTVVELAGRWLDVVAVGIVLLGTVVDGRRDGSAVVDVEVNVLCGVC